MNAERKVNHGKKDRDASTPATKPLLDESSKNKFALSDKFQSALTTQLGMTPDHRKYVWEETREESGNYIALTLGRRM